LNDIGTPDDQVAAPRFVLITQCLQNDFFLNTRCRLRLPDTVVPQMLLGHREYDLARGGNAPSSGRADAIAAGPLGIFLRAVVGSRIDDPALPVLHLVNLRDWHVPGTEYDRERRAYGMHCEAETWGADYLEGVDRYLNPTGAAGVDYAESGAVRVYHIRSDSLFDFKPRAEFRDGQRKFRASELEDVLDVVVQGSDADLEQMRTLLKEGGFAAAHGMARAIDAEDEPRTDRSTYIAVVGVLTDIKVQTLLVGLRAQYDVPNLAVSDTFTASYTLERHLAALDYAARVLDVDVVHGINELSAYLGTPSPLKDETEIVARISFARYRTHAQDKQNVLAFQDEKLQQYLALTERRSVQVYERIKRANTFLLVFGGVFLSATLVLAILSSVWPSHVKWQLVSVTGGIGLIQVVSAFFSKPIRDLQQNLTNLAVFKMILESHSLKTALARYHLTTPRTLREFVTSDEVATAQAQIEVLRRQVQTLQDFDTADFAGLAALAAAVTPPAPAAAQAPAEDPPPGVPAAPPQPV
jgi:hypothetical protein